MELNLNYEKLNNNHKNELVNDKVYDLIIIGFGPAGINAFLYAKRKGLNVGIITKKIGGQVINTSVVDNYLGTKNINGEALIDQFTEHISEFDTPILENATVTYIKSINNHHEIHLTNGTFYKTRSVIIATGSKPRQLNIPGERDLLGKGVAYCAICDAPLFKGKDVVVAGGGNSAVEAVLDMVKVAKSVTLVHRSELRADKILVDQLYQNSEINIHLKTKILEVVGKDFMTGLKTKSANGESIIPSDGLFIEIGHIPNSDFIKDYLDVNNHGEILVDEKNRTNIKGIFACGDVTQIPYKQIIIAAADGAKAALCVNEYLNKDYIK